MMLLLDPTPFTRGLASKKVEVVNYPDGRFAVRHEAVALPFRLFDKIQTVAPGAIVENKRLGAALAFVRELQASYPPNRRRGDPRDVGRRILARDRVRPDSPREGSGFEPSAPPRDRNRIAVRSSPVCADGKWMSVPYRSCKVAQSAAAPAGSNGSSTADSE